MHENLSGADQQFVEKLNILNQWLTKNTQIDADFTKMVRFWGGYSNVTFLLINNKKAHFVLRQAPEGAAEIKRGHDMVREFGILKALRQAGFERVPQPLVCCDDPAILGAPFYIMTESAGTILRTADTKQWKAQLQPADWNRLSVVLADQLAALHAIDIVSTGLIHIGKPDGYIQRQVTGWTGRYEAAQTDDLPAMIQLAEWLAANMPEEQAPALLHNDFKYDNVVFDTGLNRIEAILDWEMATVGDPRMDIGTALSYWSEAGDSPFERSFNLSWLPGNLSRVAFLERYCAKSGRNLDDMLYFFVFGLFKNAVVMQQIYSRYRKGSTDDPRFAGLIEGVRLLSAKGIAALESGQI